MIKEKKDKFKKIIDSYIYIEDAPWKDELKKNAPDCKIIFSFIVSLHLYQSC